MFENLPDMLLHPPAHSWEGPQPGLSAQADDFCRYYFSAKTGRLDHIIHYGSDGTPELRIYYRTVGDSKKVEPYEIERWNGSEFVHELKDRTFQVHELPRVMIGDDGLEKKIPLDAKDVYITPAGEVVRLESRGTFFKRPRAVYLGRLFGFNALKPFVLRRAGNKEPIAIDRKDVVIDPQGAVFQFTRDGLLALGELCGDSPVSDVLENFEIPHQLFTLRMNADVAHMDIHDPHAQQFLAGPLHTIGGKHVFIRSSVPELVDVHGGDVAERLLRNVERSALELGLVFYAMKHEQRSDVRACFLKAQHSLEEKLWKTIDVFEQTLGKSRHTIISPQDIRDWVDFAATEPHGALLQLKEMAQKKYAA
jgi:hypothetical protein